MPVHVSIASIIIYNSKKIFGDKISYLIIVFHVTKGRKMIKLERCKLVMSLSKKRTL